MQQLLNHTSGVPSGEFDSEWIRHGRGAAMNIDIALLTNVGAMHAGDSAFYPEKLLKDTRLVAAARALAVNWRRKRGLTQRH